MESNRLMESELEPEVFITVSDVMEYLFCPRFIYFMYCLGIPQHEEKRYKVLKGRALHEAREKVNRSYIRKKLQCAAKRHCGLSCVEAESFEGRSGRSFVSGRWNGGTAGL